MERRTGPHPLERRVQERIRRRGLRPGIAASVIVAFWAVGIVVFGVVMRLIDPDTFDNVWIAMWWAIQTVTTVGYGDIVPGQTGGKVIASFLMLGGLSLFAVVTGAITSAFVAEAQAQRRGREEDPVMIRLEQMSAQLEGMQAELARLRRLQ